MLKVLLLLEILNFLEVVWNHSQLLRRLQACRLSHVWLFCDTMVCSPPVSSVLGIFQTRILWLPFNLQGVFPTQGLNLGPPALQADCLPSEPSGNHSQVYTYFQTQKIIYAKYLQLCVCQSYLNKFFLKEKVMYWDILSLRAGQLLFLSISPKVWVGHAGWFCPDVVHSCLWAHSQLGGRSGQGLRSLWGCPIYGNVSASNCCSVAQSCPTLCGHVSDFVSDSFPSA